MSKDRNVEGQVITVQVVTTGGNFVGNIKYGEHLGDEGCFRIERACVLLKAGPTGMALAHIGWAEIKRSSLLNIRDVTQLPLYQDYLQAVSGLVAPPPGAMEKVNQSRN